MASSSLHDQASSYLSDFSSSSSSLSLHGSHNGNFIILQIGQLLSYLRTYAFDILTGMLFFQVANLISFRYLHKS